MGGQTMQSEDIIKEYLRYLLGYVRVVKRNEMSELSELVDNHRYEVSMA